jgi:hypothetical protein
MNFDDPASLAHSLEGAAVLFYNTYWMRQNAEDLGRHYASELSRCQRR